jgi:hypothetical protein
MKLRTGKKCIPGLFCVENFTLFVIIVLLMIIVYMYISYTRVIPKSASGNSDKPNIIIVTPSAGSSVPNDALSNPYYPPLKSELPVFSDGIPINIRTRPANADYTQIGILTKSSSGDGENVILPLFGKRSDVSRSKYQYYTMSNTGFVNTKLPVYKNNRSCTSEQGCDEIYSGEFVFVDGYDSEFNAKVYETNLLRYIPV